MCGKDEIFCVSKLNIIQDIFHLQLNHVKKVSSTKITLDAYSINLRPLVKSKLRILLFQRHFPFLNNIEIS